MAVVINEFDVIPAEPRPREAEARPADEAAARPARDPERELERLVLKRRSRAARLVAR